MTVTEPAKTEKVPESYPGEALSNLLGEIEAIRAKVLGEPGTGRKLKAEWWQVTRFPHYKSPLNVQCLFFMASLSFCSNATIQLIMS